MEDIRRWGFGLYGRYLEERETNPTLPMGVCHLYAPAVQVDLGRRNSGNQYMYMCITIKKITCE